MKTTCQRRLIAILLILLVLTGCSPKARDCTFGDLSFHIPSGFALIEYNDTKNPVLIAAGTESMNSATVFLYRAEDTGEGLVFDDNDSYPEPEYVSPDTQKKEKGAFCGIPADYTYVSGVKMSGAEKTELESWEFRHNGFIYRVSVRRDESASKRVLEDIQTLLDSFNLKK